MKIEKFEDIDAWREARKLVNMIYDVSNNGNFSNDYGLRDQIRRASISAMSNISEGFDRETNKEFIQFLIIARASVSEVKSHMYVALDRKYLSIEEFDSIYNQANTVINLINGFIRYLRKPRT
ncbi:MAG: four helix bundle protein [Nitrospinae bacterium RIFCSPLOWO2_12_FULL_45_22]|nr:MAG: four helix bundle protein [Nitrospinae bacterium RIFCSPLOWO2_12_FULL_45_22]